MKTKLFALLASFALAHGGLFGCDDDGGDGDDSDSGTDGDTDADTDTETDTEDEGGPWMGCADYNDCLWACSDDQACEDECASLIAQEGQDLWNIVITCVDENCEGLTGDDFNTCFSQNCADVWTDCTEHRGLDPDYVEVDSYCNSVGSIAHNVFWFDVDGDLHTFRDDFFGQYPAILFILSAGWCVPCQQEAATLPGLQEEYGAENLAILQLLTDGFTQGSEVTTGVVQTWQDNYMDGANLAGGNVGYMWIDFVANPASFSVPFAVVIDGETMEIKAMGNAINTAAIDALMP